MKLQFSNTRPPFASNLQLTGKMLNAVEGTGHCAQLGPHLLQRMPCPLSLSGSTTAATQVMMDQPVLHLLREGEDDGGGRKLPGLSKRNFLQVRPVISATACP